VAPKRGLNGNPLFFTQLLVALGRAGLVRLDRTTGSWSWEADGIRAEALGDSVVDLMARRLERCAPETRRTLALASCLGSSFELERLAAVADRSVEETAGALGDAVGEGLVLRSSGGYRFPHDRVQEVSYAQIPEAERPATHLGIGRALLAGTPPEALPERVFEIAGQLNRGMLALREPGERLELARLNRLAAQRARASAAFAAAADYCAAGLSLLEPDGWAAERELAFALAVERAECELYGGKLEVVEQLLAVAGANARTRLERALCRRIEVDLHTTAGRSMEALETAIDCLRMYDLQLTPHPALEQVEEAERLLWERLGDRPLEAFLDLPLADDADIEAALDLLARMLPSAYFVDLHLHRLIACYLVDLTLRYGVAAPSPMGLAAYGRSVVRRHIRQATAPRCPSRPHPHVPSVCGLPRQPHCLGVLSRVLVRADRPAPSRQAAELRVLSEAAEEGGLQAQFLGRRP
jgi:predicted ATPase